MLESELIVRRDKTRWQDLARDYHLMVDGKSVAKIGHGKDARIALAPGKHTVQMKIDWCTSPAVQIESVAGQQLVLDCGANAKPLLDLLYITLWKGKYIWLRPANAAV